MDKPTITLTPDATEQDAIDQIEGWLLPWAATTLKLDGGKLDPDTVFMELGLDSVDAVFMISELEAMLKVSLPTSIVLEHPTPRLLAQHVARVWATRSGQPSAERAPEPR